MSYFCSTIDNMKHPRNILQASAMHACLQIAERSRYYLIALSLLASLTAVTVLYAQSPISTAAAMEQQGMVNVQLLDSTIHVSLMYSRPDNFTGTVLYTDLRDAYLHPKAVEALLKAQKRLRQLRPDLSIIVFDAARPMSIQQKMWDKVKGTSKYFYVSNPANGGGMHNYGLAVDISLCNAATGDTIPMGTTIDHMSPLSHITDEPSLVSNGLISPEALANRQLLRSVMTYAGFKPLATEWWHFNLVSRAVARKYYNVIK